MPLGRFLPEFLRGTDGDRGEPDAAAGTVIYECRHCGTDFDEQCERCPVCGATEIATYEFGPGIETESESETGSKSESASEAED